MEQSDHEKDKLPPLAIASGAIGLVLTAGLIGFIGWEATQRAEAKVPAVTIEQGKVYPASSGFVLEFEARNTTAHTAAGVEVEARLETPGAEPIVSSVTLDYVPGHSTRKGGVFFTSDPRQGRLELRAQGYSTP